MALGRQSDGKGDAKGDGAGMDKRWCALRSLSALLCLVSVSPRRRYAGGVETPEDKRIAKPHHAVTLHALLLTKL